MSRLLAIGLACVLALTACRGAEVATAVPTVDPPVEPADYALTLHETRDPAPATKPYLVPKPGTRWVSVDVSIANSGTRPFAYNRYYFTLRTTDGREYRPVAGGTDPAINAATQQPGDTIRGWVTIEVPEGATPATLTYDPAGGRDPVVFDLR